MQMLQERIKQTEHWKWGISGDFFSHAGFKSLQADFLCCNEMVWSSLSVQGKKSNMSNIVVSSNDFKVMSLNMQSNCFWFCNKKIIYNESNKRNIVKCLISTVKDLHVHLFSLVPILVPLKSEKQSGHIFPHIQGKSQSLSLLAHWPSRGQKEGGLRTAPVQGLLMICLGRP